MKFRQTRFDWLLVAAVLVLIAFGCWAVLRPFLSAICWAAILTYSLWPVQKQVRRICRGHRGVAAGIVTLLVATLLLLPATFIVIGLGENIREFSVATANWMRDGMAGPPQWVRELPGVGSSLAAYWEEAANDSRRLLSDAKALIEPATDSLIKASVLLGAGAAELFLSVFISFFFLRHGEELAAWASRIATRLAGERGRYMFEEVGGSTVRGVVYGMLGTALIQGLLAGFGFAMAGVPAALLLGLLTFLLSPVPFGPPMVWVPAVIWSFQHQSTPTAIYLLLLGTVVSTVDNVVRPYFISQESKVPFLLVFFGVVGGILSFGLIGIFLGPTLLVLGYRLCLEWLKDSDLHPEPTSSR